MEETFDKYSVLQSKLSRNTCPKFGDFSQPKTDFQNFFVGRKLILKIFTTPVAKKFLLCDVCVLYRWRNSILRML